MSLLKCIECNHDVSEYSDKCPNCGCPIDIIIKSYKKEETNRLYTIINGEKKDVTYFVEKILNNTWKEDVKTFNIKLMDELDISLNSFISAVESCGGAPKEINTQSISEWRKRQKVKDACLPRCPMCGSTNIQKISDFSRASSILGFGILSKKIGKQWQCNNPKCKNLW